MKIGNRVKSALLIMVIAINFMALGLNTILVSQSIENQMVIASHLDSLTDYLSIISGEALEQSVTEANFDLHVRVEQYRDGQMVGFSEHAGVLTTFGANWIEDQLGDSPSATTIAKYIGCDDDASAPSSAWTALPSETTGNGMDRATGTYASTGDGEWTITATFSPTASGTVSLVGLFHTSTGSNLVASDDVTDINYQNGDSIEITFTITVS